MHEPAFATDIENRQTPDLDLLSNFGEDEKTPWANVKKKNSIVFQEKTEF